jgi:Secretion system C-terminal sorting domain
LELQTQADIISATVLNQNYSTGTAYEALEKQVNAIYLNDFAGKEAIETNNLSEIETIADLCPETDGLAVFKARGMYLMAGGLPKSTWDKCNQKSKMEERMEGFENITITPMAKVYPNPAHTILYLETSVPDPIYKVYNLLGMIILEGSLEGQAGSLDISQLNNGLHFIAIEGVAKPIKFVVAH